MVSHTVINTHVWEMDRFMNQLQKFKLLKLEWFPLRDKHFNSLNFSIKLTRGIWNISVVSKEMKIVEKMSWEILDAVLWGRLCEKMKI
jgi:hypothetical protein